MYTIYHKVTTKRGKQRGIANKLTKELKWNYKKIIIIKEQKKDKKPTRQIGNK